MIVGESPRVRPNYAGLRTCPHQLSAKGRRQSWLRAMVVRVGGNSRTLAARGQVRLMKLALVALLALALGGAKVADEQRTGEISVISSSGGTTHPLTSGPALQPSLSPDGRTLAFVSDQIRVMSTDGSGQRPAGTANGERPQWSPNGASLVYTAWDVSGCVTLAQKCAMEGTTGTGTSLEGAS